MIFLRAIIADRGGHHDYWPHVSKYVALPLNFTKIPITGHSHTTVCVLLNSSQTSTQKMFQQFHFEIVSIILKDTSTFCNYSVFQFD